MVIYIIKVLPKTVVRHLQALVKKGKTKEKAGTKVTIRNPDDTIFKASTSFNF